MSLNAPVLPDPYGWPVAADPFTALPPSYRQPALITLCLQCGIIGLLIWDCLKSVAFDVRLIFRSDWRSFKAASINSAYLLSRYFALIFALLAVCSITTKQTNCAILPRVYETFLILTIASTSYIFALRVAALYSYSKRIIAVVFLFFLIALGFSIATVVNPGGVHVPHSPYCTVDFSSRPWLAGTAGAVFAFDTVVAILTVYKIAHNARASPLTLVMDRATPPLTKLLLKAGLAYYVIAGASEVVAVVFFALKLPPHQSIFHVMWAIAAVAIQACMACEVFRLIREELECPSKHIVSHQLSFGTAHSSPVGDSPGSEKKDFYGSLSPSHSLRGGIAFTRHTDTLTTTSPFGIGQAKRFAFDASTDAQELDLEKAPIHECTYDNASEHVPPFTTTTEKVDE